MLDEREAAVDPAELDRAFTRRPCWQRILVLLAGPAANILFAILLLAAMTWTNGVTEVRPVVGEVLAGSPAARAGLLGGDTITALEGRPVAGQRDVVYGLIDAMTDTGRIALTVTDRDGAARGVMLDVADPVERHRLSEPEALFRGLGFGFWQPPLPSVLGAVEAGGPAARAGLKPGDEILSVNGEAVSGFLALKQRIEAHGGDEIVLAYRRKGVESSLRVAVAREDAAGKGVGRIHVSPAGGGRYPASMLRHVSPGLLQSLRLGAVDAWDMTALQARMFWRMVLGQVSLKNLSGPLTIAEFAGDSAAAGPGAFVGFLVLISLSLGFLNLLPIPVLDGGQIVWQLVEWARGGPLPERIQAIGQQAGIALLVLLMGVALFNDIARQFG
jgi:regulator of sigma E protease